MSHSHRKPPTVAIVAVPLITALVLTLFAWPNARLEPRELPIGVAGPEPAVATIEQRLAAQEGAFEVHRYADEASAREAIADREVYGALSPLPGVRRSCPRRLRVRRSRSYSATPPAKRRSRTWHPHRAEALWAHLSCRSSSPGS
jgi:hypothetical protein